MDFKPVKKRDGSTVTSTVFIKATGYAGTPLILQIPVPTAPVQAQYQTFTLTLPPPNGIAVTTVPIHILTEAVFSVVDVFDGIFELVTLKQSSLDQAVSTVIVLGRSAESSITSSYTEENSATTEAVQGSISAAVAPTGMAAITSKITYPVQVSFTTLDGMTGAAPVTNGSTPINVHQSSTMSVAATSHNLVPSTGAVSDGTVAKQPLSIGQKVFISLGVVIGVLIIGAVLVIRCFEGRKRYKEAIWREHKRKTNLEVQQRRLAEFDWNAKVITESGGEITAWQYYELNRLAMERCEQHQAEAVEMLELERVNAQRALDGQKAMELSSTNHSGAEEQRI